MQSPRGDAACDDSPRVELVHVLNGKAERKLGALGRFAELSERVEHRWSRVPWHRCSAFRHVIAIAGAYGYELLRFHPKLSQVGPVLADDGIEGVASIPDEVHLIDDH